MLILRLLVFVKIAQEEFSDIVKDVEIHDDRIRLTLLDASILDVRYPKEDKYSFHWQKISKIYRIDTAPHHMDIKTFPRHIHSGSEENIIADNITDFDNLPEDNFRNVMKWVSGLMEI